ncbi:ESX secretion-associated protein EspG [Amycolatopsis anabasis]|uniref:ESX secretion-associated protein EspG n=1 Tax=Amycolatopsis anabasis TaxID=1840409 RepID=UPI00131E7C0E|nr:ESX secretion-associated protein EspG [Amycolatopsis anabasis]
MLRSFSLPQQAMDALWGKLGLGQHVFPFTVPDGPRNGAETPSPDVERALTLLAGSQRAVAVCGVLAGGRNLLARVAVKGEQAVLAVHQAERFFFQFIYPESVERECVHLLPRERAAPGVAVASDLHAAQAIFARPRLRSGYFTAFARGRDGRERQLGTLAWIDNADGRYCMTEQGRRQGTVAPADDANLTRQLSELLTRHFVG